MCSRTTRILYLSYDGLTDPLGQSQILPYLQGLSAEYAITIMSFEKAAAFAAHGAEVRRICELSNLSWLPLQYHKVPPVMSTLYDLWMLRRRISRLVSEKRPHIVHCRSYVTSIVGLWAKRKFGIRLVFDMRGFWPDERVEGGLWNVNNPFYSFIYKYFKRQEKEFLRAADHVISLTDNARAEIQSWKLTSAPISVIPTCADLNLFNPEKFREVGQRLRSQLSFSDEHFVLVYLGSWGTWYMTSWTLAFFSALVSVNPNARLLILTPDQPALRKYQHADKVSVRKATRQEVPAYLAAANASVCFIKPSFSKKASSATKISESWAMNLPVVTNAGWGDIEKLHESGFPLLICQSPSDYQNVAKRLLSGEFKIRREMLLGQFDLVSGIEKYRAVYTSLHVI